MVGVESLAGNDAPSVDEFIVRHVGHVRKAGNVVFLLVVRLQFAEDLNGDLEIIR